MKKNNTFLYVITPLLVSGLYFPCLTQANETSISNTISVQASNGSSKAYVHTEVNGAVIEDISYTSEDESIAVHSTYNDEEHTTIITHETVPADTTALHARLTELLALLQYYVSLLQ